MQQVTPVDISVGKFVTEHLPLVISTVVGIVTVTATVVGYICAAIVKAKEDRVAWLQDQLAQEQRRVDDLKSNSRHNPGLAKNEQKAVKRAESAYSFFSNVWRVFVLGMLIYALYLQTSFIADFNIRTALFAEQQRKTDDAIGALNKRLSLGAQGSGSTSRSSAGGALTRGKGMANSKSDAKSTDAKKAFGTDDTHKVENPTPSPTPAP